MPFKSKKQQRFMFATKPDGVDLKEWSKETNFDKLPESARKKKKKSKPKDKSECAQRVLDMANTFDRMVQEYNDVMP